VEFADLPIIDLSKTDTPEGRAELYPQLRDALRTHGFLYAINHGYTQARVLPVLVAHAQRFLNRCCSVTGSLT
jgi:isopenicillin N synthase-like dioxygenase